MISPSELPDPDAPAPDDGTEQSRLRKDVESQGSSRRGRGAPLQPSQPAPIQNLAPVQPPPPRQPITAADVQPGGPIFSRPRMAPTWGMRQGIRIAAAHPDAGPWMGAMVKRLDDEERARGTTPSQGPKPKFPVGGQPQQ